MENDYLIRQKPFRALLVFALLLWCTAVTPGKVADPATYTCAVYSTFFSLLPPVIAIVLALNTKEVYTSLLVGIATGALLYAKTDADCAPGAGVDMTQILMGQGDLYSDNDTELVGDGSRYSAQIGYLGRGSQTIDVNVVVNHYGKNTECEIDTSGALKDAAKKVFRGTIDFKTGSSNSVGNEKETVLMLGDDVVNKTVPLILCAEENVVGNHGATIGELDDETLFYFESRGISRAQAENILARASIERFARTVDDEALRAQILQTLEEELNDDV